MSVQATTWVWTHSQSGGNARLVLLALADHAHPDGTHAFPSVATLAAMCKISERTIQRTLRELEGIGEIVVVREATRYYPTEYAIPGVTQSVGRGVNLSPLPLPGVTPDASGVTKDPPRGDTAVSPEPKNPSLRENPSSSSVTNARASDHEHEPEEEEDQPPGPAPPNTPAEDLLRNARAVPPGAEPAFLTWMQAKHPDVGHWPRWLVTAIENGTLGDHVRQWERTRPRPRSEQARAGPTVSGAAADVIADQNRTRKAAPQTRAATVAAVRKQLPAAAAPTRKARWLGTHAEEPTRPRAADDSTQEANR